MNNYSDNYAWQGPPTDMMFQQEFGMMDPSSSSLDIASWQMTDVCTYSADLRRLAR
jgi:hypothetical protein